MTDKKKDDANFGNIALANVRLAFSQALFEKKQVNGEGAPAFSAVGILAPNHPQMPALKKLISDVAAKKWGAKAPAILAELYKKDKVFLRNGDDKTQYDGFEGNMYISARSSDKVTVVDNVKDEETGKWAILVAADGRPYAGCYVNYSINVWAQDNKFGKRINAKLRSVQWVKGGDAFAGSPPSDASEFDDLSDGADADDVA